MDPVLGYLDPGSGSVILQALLGGLAGLAAGLGGHQRSRASPELRVEFRHTVMHRPDRVLNRRVLVEQAGIRLGGLLRANRREREKTAQTGDDDENQAPAAHSWQWYLGLRHRT